MRKEQMIKHLSDTVLLNHLAHFRAKPIFPEEEIMDIANLTIQQIDNLPNTQDIFDQLTALGLAEESTWKKLVIIAIRDYVFARRMDNHSMVPYCCYDCSYNSHEEVLLKKFCGSEPTMPIELYMITGLLNMFHKGEHQELKYFKLFVNYSDAIDILRGTAIRFCYKFSYTRHIGDMNKE